MRALFVGALAATLVGCSCFVSPQASFDACTGADGNGFACFGKTAFGPTNEPEPASRNADLSTPRAKAAIAARTEKPPSAHTRDRTKVAGRKPTPAAAIAKVEPVTAKVEPAATKAEPAAAKVEPSASKVEVAAAKVEPAAAKVQPPASGQPAETSDQIIAKAKITVAAKLEDPASAKFGEMRRAMRINMLGQSVDTICGRVRGKKPSGEDTGDRSFLYLVKEDEAFVVDGPPSSGAATAYRNICN
jgi:hypothetical protein